MFATDYRSELISTPQWKDVYRDTECGYRYARSVAANYGGDLDGPVTIVGHSLGATVALVLGLNESVFGTDIEPLVGSDTDYSAETALNPTIYAEAGPFAESSARSFLPAHGTYVVECALGGAIPTYVWWLAALEVTP